MLPPTHFPPIHCSIYCFDILLKSQYASLLHTPTMARRELCPCCFQMVTKTQLKKHAEEATKKQSITTMGRNPAIPATKLRIKPITGNDIFLPQALPPTPAPPVDEGTSCPNTSVGSYPSVTSPPLPIPSHSIEDNDFPPDDVERLHNPPQVPEPPNYPSMETSDADEDSSETEDQGEIRDELNLNEFLDDEYLEQGRSSA